VYKEGEKRSSNHQEKRRARFPQSSNHQAHKREIEGCRVNITGITDERARDKEGPGIVQATRSYGEIRNSTVNPCLLESKASSQWAGGVPQRGAQKIEI